VGEESGGGEVKMFFDKISDTNYDIYRREPKSEDEKSALWIGCFYKCHDDQWRFNTDEQSTWRAEILHILADRLDSLNVEIESNGNLDG